MGKRKRRKLRLKAVCGYPKSWQKYDDISPGRLVIWGEVITC